MVKEKKTDSDKRNMIRTLIRRGETVERIAFICQVTVHEVEKVIEATIQDL